MKQTRTATQVDCCGKDDVKANTGAHIEQGVQEKFISKKKAPVKEKMAIMTTQPMARRLAQGMEIITYSNWS